MNERITVWAVIAAIAALGVVGSLYLYPAVSPEDSEGLARSLILRIATMFVGFVFLLLALIATDVVTPGDWLAGIHESPTAQAIVIASLIAGLSLIFIYS